MKSTFKNDNIHSLSNVDNFKYSLDDDISIIIIKYSELVMKFLNYIKENINSKKREYRNFIITRGLDTVTHVFIHLLYYTNNLDITFFHCEKAFYFYVEFVSQISTEEKTYLQLSTRDASNYVYKKTIFDIKHECKKQTEKCVVNKIDFINTYTNLYKTILYKIINSNDKNEIHTIDTTDTVDKINTTDTVDKINTTDTVDKINTIDKINTVDKHSKTIEYIFHKLNHFPLTKDSIIFLENAIDFLYYKVKNTEKFIEMLVYFIKVISKNINLLEIVERKRKNENLDIYLNDNDIKKCIDWLIKE